MDRMSRMFEFKWEGPELAARVEYHLEGMTELVRLVRHLHMLSAAAEMREKYSAKLGTYPPVRGATVWVGLELKPSWILPRATLWLKEHIAWEPGYRKRKVATLYFDNRCTMKVFLAWYRNKGHVLVEDLIKRWQEEMKELAIQPVREGFDKLPLLTLEGGLWLRRP